MSKRINKKVSRTAQMVCFLRALSYYEIDETYKSSDYLSPIFLPFLMRTVLKIRFLREKVKNKLSKTGMYEYIVGRTKVVDDAFNEFSSNINQVVILGAGFDSRAIRFSDLLSDAIIYELDSYRTQQFKIKKVNKHSVPTPKNLKMIPIDFDNESFSEVLAMNNFKNDEPCLFLLEGLTMFLNPDSINKLFKEINNLCGINSVIIFDYLYDIALNDESNDGKEVTKTVSSIGEKYKFGIEKGSIADFTSQYGFKLLEEYDSDKLQNEFFSNMSQKNNIPIDLFSIVKAKKLSN